MSVVDDEANIPSDPKPSELESLFAHYVERLNSGESLEPKAILAKHPEIGEELLRHLEEFVDLGDKQEPRCPLGTLGDYELLRTLGRGGMGVVYEAWENSMERRVALKVLPAGIAADEKTFSRFCREARLAGKLHHPHVVPVFGMGMKGESPHFAMEFVEGETLAQIIDRARGAGEKNERSCALSSSGQPDQRYYLGVADAFAGVAEGLQHAHSQGIVHRDIKPSNLILDDRSAEAGDRGSDHGRLRILDFGLARLEGQESLTLSGDFVGTPLYMSPEQASRRGHNVDHRTDVYSLGATMYEVLTWQPPFRGKDHADTLNQIVDRDSVAPRELEPRIPLDLETIVLKCLRKEPSDRYGTAEALAQDLRRFVRGDPIEARPRTRWEKLRRRLWRRRSALAAALLVAALVVTVVAFLWQSHLDSLRQAQDEYRRRVRSAVIKIQFGQLAPRYVWGKRSWLLRGGDPLGRLEDLGPNVFEATLEDLGDAIRLRPNGVEAFYYRARARLLLRTRDAESEALSDLEHSLRLDPDFLPAIALKRALSGQRAELETWLDGRASREDPARYLWAKDWLEAFLATRDEDWEKAALAYDQLTLWNAGDELYLGAAVESLVGLGVSLYKAEKFVEAARVFDRARRRWTESVEAGLLLLGKCHYRLGDETQAAQVFAELYRSAEPADMAAFWIAATYASLGASERGFQWATKIENEKLRVTLELWLHYFLYQHDDAIRAAERLVKIAPEDSHAWYMRGVVCLRRRFPFFRKAIPEATRYLETALDLDPKNDQALALLGLAHFCRGELERAERLCRQAIRVNPRSLSGYRFLTTVLYLGGRTVEAMSHEATLLELGAETAYVQRAHALLAAQRGDYDEALRASVRAADLDPYWAYPSTDAGVLALRQGRSTEAVGHFRRAVDRAARSEREHLGSAYSRLVLALAETGQLDEARSVASEAIRELPATRPLGYYLRAWVETRTGQLELAGVDLLEALAVLPSLRQTQTALHRLLGDNPGFRLPANASLEKARSALQGASSASDADPLLLSTLALLSLSHANGDDGEAAVALAQRALETMDPSAEERPDALSALAQIQFETGERAAAVQSLEETVRLPGAAERHRLLLERYREALRPETPTFASVDAALSAQDPSQDQELVKLASALPAARRSESRLAYLRGRALQRSGDWGAALPEFQRSAASETERPEPHLRVAECLEALGDPQAADVYLYELLSRGSCSQRDLGERWVALALRTPGSEPHGLLERLWELPAATSKKNPGEPEYVALLRWLLARLAGEETIRIDCGGREDYRGPDGELWSRDRFYVGGRWTLSHYAGRYFQDEVRGTQRDRLYHTERRFPPDELGTGYRIPLPPGSYRVTLHFAEIHSAYVGFYFTDLPRVERQARGPRRFDVLVENQVVLKDYEPLLRAGFATAHVVPFETEVADGVLDLVIIPRVWNAVLSAFEIERLK